LGDRPGIDFFSWRKDLLSARSFGFEKAFEVEEFFGNELVLEMGEP
jgi:hypothetical protein